MIGPVVVGEPVASPILLVGQAPGDREPKLGRPFAWTAGKTLFKWFGGLGLDEATFRQRVYMAAVCRCFPGKLPKGGDRVPSPIEISACRSWLDRELNLVAPELLLPVGRLAIEQFLPPRPLVDQIGRLHQVRIGQRMLDVLPLPHPSGASTWFRTEPGRTLLEVALKLLSKHPAWTIVRQS
jgi:uracil-DNA glycosylase